MQNTSYTTEKPRNGRVASGVGGRTSSFVWKDDFSVNVGMLDVQHRRLVELIAKVEGAMLNGVASTILGSVFDDLAGYCLVHFAAEEQAMERYKYPLHALHKAEHRRLVDRVAQFQRQVRSGEAVVGIDVLEFLFNWLQSHIVRSDKRFGAFLNERGVR